MCWLLICTGRLKLELGRQRHWNLQIIINTIHRVYYNFSLDIQTKTGEKVNYFTNTKWRYPKTR